MAQTEVGRVDKYFRKVGVVALELSAAIAVGDKLRFSGATTNFEMKLESMQIDHEVVESAAAGADVGIAVPERVRRSDTVYRVSD
ncbi:MAG: translation elongation factor-like protein [Candidatus Poseidoniia archaeon]|jgi:putative protease|nr:translation elongation factor-like protein [Euryarchaeota archaeon]MDP7136512.1 translation elongation factor-like protein [Candidatus Poseidoniia archaeon]MDP7243579.1 translation elongation factor-like protein [Candidatus Poseidoniia archaeon]MDP7535990.1 translation elongation factor-like protein [Candidatus Poseidoniia archaeon]MDP7590898.1 translation elongation factor-like protein [Candidatus Poseidoniia archaeon]|tara:strand:- start:306 stop:560 length:255 start_codon:yes stop_codon:yes gene_type:complete